MRLLKEAEMRAIKLVGLVTLLCASTLFAQTNVVTWSLRAEATDYDGNPLDLAALNPSALPPIDNGDGTFSPNGILLNWTVYCNVTGNNQGLGGAMVSMGVKEASAPFGVWAPVEQPADGLALAPVYKSPGTLVNGTAADSATAGGLGASPGAGKGWPVPGVFYVDQMGMGYLDWSARRYKTTNPKGWVGNQQWGMGLESRKASLLAKGIDGTYDLVNGTIDITSLAPGTYNSMIVLKDQDGKAVTTSKVLAPGLDLNTDWPAVDFLDATVAQGDVFSFTILVPEPATLLLLAGAGLLAARRRRA